MNPTPLTRITGKISGIFGEIITQVLIYALGLAGCYYAAPYIGGVSDSFNKFKPMIDQVVGNLLSWGLLFTVLALVLFIIFAAFCGALTAKSENANKAVSPLTTVGIVASWSQSTCNQQVIRSGLRFCHMFHSYHHLLCQWECWKEMRLALKQEFQLWLLC